MNKNALLKLLNLLQEWRNVSIEYNYINQNWSKDYEKNKTLLRDYIEQISYFCELNEYPDVIEDLVNKNSSIYNFTPIKFSPLDIKFIGSSGSDVSIDLANTYLEKNNLAIISYEAYDMHIGFFLIPIKNYNQVIFYLESIFDIFVITDTRYQPFYSFSENRICSFGNSFCHLFMDNNNIYSSFFSAKYYKKWLEEKHKQEFIWATYYLGERTLFGGYGFSINIDKAKNYFQLYLSHFFGKNVPQPASTEIYHLCEASRFLEDENKITILFEDFMPHYSFAIQGICLVSLGNYLEYKPEWKKGKELFLNCFNEILDQIQKNNPNENLVTILIAMKENISL